ncbi:MAG: hypothetical protein MZV63_56550 [Marinilabiliales bacterium]|nr:hypothetical protein [Marinilabiliales bacterium]
MLQPRRPRGWRWPSARSAAISSRSTASWGSRVGREPAARLFAGRAGGGSGRAGGPAARPGRAAGTGRLALSGVGVGGPGRPV